MSQLLHHTQVAAILSTQSAEAQATYTKSATSPVMRVSIRRKDNGAVLHREEVPGSDPGLSIDVAVRAFAAANKIPIPTAAPGEVEELRTRVMELSSLVSSLSAGGKKVGQKGDAK